jgi:hypothetical protein
MTSIIAMKPFQEQFGVKDVGTGAAVIFSLYVVYVSPAPWRVQDAPILGPVS